MTDYDAVLFDNDGVLIEPPPDERQRAAARAAFADCGIEDADGDHLDAIASGVTRERLDDVCATHGLDVETLWAARDRHDQRLQREDVEAGRRTTYDDVDTIADCAVPRGVVSNNHHATVEFVLDHFGLADLFETRYGRERSVAALRRKKPDPHYLERARTDLGAETALYVGDRPHDVRAAHNAGLDAAFVRRDHTADVDLDAELATAPAHEIESLRELPALLNGRRE